MTCLTVPFGSCTMGRFRPLRFCAATGITDPARMTAIANHNTALSDLCFIDKSLGESGQTSRAVADVVQVNVVEIENAQQHVRVPLRIVREYKVTVALESAVDSADKLDRNFLVGVPVRI